MPRLVFVVADGLRPDSLDAAIARGDVPALAALRAAGGTHELTTCFPSVTGLAYVPFVMGCHPAEAGLPGLRWVDRTRRAVRLPAHARSYVGYGIKRLDGDVDATRPTLFERAQPAMTAMSMITRGVPHHRRIARGWWWGMRGIRTHYFGHLDDWLRVDEEVAQLVTRRVARERPRLTLAAFMGIDKASHARGHDSAEARQALRIVDRLVGTLRAQAAGDADPLHVWVASDHGHSAVDRHDEIADVVRATGARVIAHPWVIGARGDVAVMVGGNAMAQLYLEPARRDAAGWPALAPRWGALADALLARESVDLLFVRVGPGVVRVRSRAHGDATVIAHGTGLALEVEHVHDTGDPLGAPVGRFTRDEAWAVTEGSAYPDALVQCALLAQSPRVGDLWLSAAPGWDFRARYEPMPHVSTHGALARAQMRVPFLCDTPPTMVLRRTTDLHALAEHALGLAP